MMRSAARSFSARSLVRAGSSFAAYPPASAAILARNQQLLDAVARMDWQAYSSMCDESLSCFELEAKAHLAEGLQFHKIYYDAAAAAAPGAKPLKQATMASPHVRFVGSKCAVLSYVRLVQTVAPDGAAHTASAQETRIWELQKGAGEAPVWKHVHFHRTTLA